MTRLLGGIAALGLVLGAPVVSRAQPHFEAVPKAVTPVAPQEFRDRGDGVLWEGRVAEPGASHLRLRFDGVAVPPGTDVVVTIRRADGRALARYTAAEFGQSPSWYSDVFFEESVRVQVTGRLPLTGFSFRIEEVLRGLPLQGRVTPQSTVASWRDVGEVRGRLKEDLLASVAKLFVGSGVTCTGFLVTSQAILTNFHCLAESPAFKASQGRPTVECGDIAVHFDFDRQPQPEAAVRARCARVLKADAELDYALLDLGAAVAPIGRVVRRPLPLATAPVTQAAEGHIIHHPGGLSKKVSLGCAFFLGADGRIEHECSTIGGSSGSPLLDASETVIGLHHEGAYPRHLTVGQIDDAIRAGVVFRNKAKAAHVIREQIRPNLP